jgi:hypothetical protein
MSFVLPSFNVFASVWRPPNAPPATEDFTYACQLYFTSKGQFDIEPRTFENYNPPIYLRVPKGTDLQVDDIVECEPASGWFYVVRFVERVHLGFANEYFLGILEQQSTTPPPGVDHIILESGDDVLLESGDLILLE